MTTGRTRGQRAGLTRGDVLAAAMSIVDGEGLQALSMRRLGRELGVEAMAIYSHVSSKEAVLDGLVERVFAEASPSLFEAASWQNGLRTYAHSLLATLRAHPNVLPLVVTRPAITSHNMQLMESALGVLQASGFPLDVAHDVLYSTTSLVIGHAVTMVGVVGVHQPTEGEPSRPRIDPDEFPLFAEAINDRRAGEPSDRFDFGLSAMLAGFDRTRSAP